MNYGVVAEFNPFHNGHKHLVEQLKADGVSTVTAVMSESFVQRGECAFLDVNARVKAAISCGVDLVLSLPVNCAVASAEKFAFGGISTLNALGIIDTIAFGSECGDAALLEKVAEIITTDEFSATLENRLCEGLSFPTARQRALADMYGVDFAEVLRSPNDILGVEYIKALNALNSPCGVLAVKRAGASHDGAEASGNICSASLIRTNGFENAEQYVPECCRSIYTAEYSLNRAPADMKKLDTAVLAKLRTMSAADFRQLPDVTEGLEHRFFAAVREARNVDEVLEKVKTKRYTHSRLRRILLCAFLGIDKAVSDIAPPYVRVLGFNENGERLLRSAKGKAALPVVAKSSQVSALGGNAERIFALECTARDMFSLALPVPEVCGREMTDKLVVIKNS